MILLEDFEIHYLITNNDYRMELRRIELRAFRMQSEHSTTELQPPVKYDHMFSILAFNDMIVFSTMELRRIEFRSSHMRSEHSTSELQPLQLQLSFALNDLQRW